MPQQMSLFFATFKTEDMTKLEKFIDDLKCFNCGFLWLNKVIMNH